MTLNRRTEALANFLNRYRLGEQVGTGTGSKIFLATDLLTGKQCAVKHVERNSPIDDKLRQIRDETEQLLEIHAEETPETQEPGEDLEM